MKRKEVELFDKTYAQMEALYTEIASLSKKSPTDGVNKFKLKFINKVLGKANSLLKEKYKPFEDFEVFEEDDLPTNSDVTMILSQYLGCIEELHHANILMYGGDWWWVIDGERSDVRTSCPKKLKR